MSNTDKNRQLVKLSECGRFWKVPFEILTLPEQTFRLIVDLESDVIHGGLFHYYDSGFGDMAIEAVEALERIGARLLADLMRQANNLFPGGMPPEERTVRQQHLTFMNERQLQKLENLNTDFLYYPDNITELLHKYVTKHASQIEGSALAGFVQMIPPSRLEDSDFIRP